MRCPYCDSEMELGLVQSPHEIAWLKGDTKHAFAIAAAHKDAIVLSPLNIKNLITGCAVRAFLCRSCKKVIIDYSDNRVDQIMFCRRRCCQQQKQS